MTANEITKTESGGTLAAASGVSTMFGVTKIQLPVDAPIPQAKIMRESPQFEMPDGSFQKDLIGHIIYYTNANQYYSAAFGEGESPVPDCFSSNGIEPDGGTNQRPGPCRTCPMNEFGSASDGSAKACQNTIRLYVLLDGDILPTLIKASPSSLGKKESLMKWLTSAPNQAARAGNGVAYQTIKVKFSLHKKDFESGFSASVLDLSTVRAITTKDDMPEMQKIAGLYKQFMASYAGRIADDIASEKVEEPAAAGNGVTETAGSRAEDDCPI